MSFECSFIASIFSQRRKIKKFWLLKHKSLTRLRTDTELLQSFWHLLLFFKTSCFFKLCLFHYTFLLIFSHNLTIHKLHPRIINISNCLCSFFNCINNCINNVYAIFLISNSLFSEKAKSWPSRYRTDDIWICSLLLY